MESICDTLLCFRSSFIFIYAIRLLLHFLFRYHGIFMPVWTNRIEMRVPGAFFFSSLCYRFSLVLFHLSIHDVKS